MKNIIPEKISIQFIKAYKTLVIASEEFLTKPVKPHSIKVNFGQMSAFNFEKKKIRIRIDVILDGLNITGDDIGLHGEFGMEYHLHVKNLQDFVVEEMGQKKVSGMLGETLMGIVYSTSRGIILEKTQGTYFNGAIIPIISPRDLIEPPKESTKKL
jgi:hypothetical protein